MNFPVKDIRTKPGGGSLNKFVTEKDLEEKKAKQLEEWKANRKEGDPEEPPEEEYDGRSLFERLEENRKKKEAEREDADKVAYFNDHETLEESTIHLKEVAEAKNRLQQEKQQEEQDVLNQLKKRRLDELDEEDVRLKVTTESIPSSSSSGSSGRSSLNQKNLLKGIIKKKTPPLVPGDDERVIKGTSIYVAGMRKSAMVPMGTIPGIDYSSDSERESLVSSSDDEGIFLPSLSQIPAKRAKKQCQQSQ